MAATAANVHDSQLLGDLLHGEETRVWGDSAYAGQGDVIREHAPNAAQSGGHFVSRALHSPVKDAEGEFKAAKDQIQRVVDSDEEAILRLALNISSSLDVLYRKYVMR